MQVVLTVSNVKNSNSHSIQFWTEVQSQEMIKRGSRRRISWVDFFKNLRGGEGIYLGLKS